MSEINDAAIQILYSLRFAITPVARRSIQAVIMVTPSMGVMFNKQSSFNVTET